MGVAIMVGALWGFGEATLFFVVPDVALTLLAIIGPAPAWAACVAAVAGALVGGAVMYAWGARDGSRIEEVLLRIPAIDEREVAGVRTGVERYGFGAVFLGPLRGTPYKLYAAEVGHRGLSLPLFLAISIPARGMRFVAVTLLALWLADGPLEGWTPQATAALAVAFWVVFYATYFRLKGASGTPGAPSP